MGYFSISILPVLSLDFSFPLFIFEVRYYQAIPLEYAIKAIKNTFAVVVLYVLILSVFSEMNYGRVIVQAETGAIRGFVTDKSTGEAIPFANLFLENTTIGAATDNNGFYHFAGIPTGSHQLIISCIGYQRKEVKIYVTRESLIQINIELEPVPFELEELSVVADKPVGLNEDNLSMKRYTPQEIIELPGAIETDAIRVLQYSAGVSSTGDASGRFYVRGGGNDQNLVLYNGATVYNPFHAFGIFSIVDPEVISVLELFKGGYSAEYGERVSSVLNIVSRDGNKNEFSGSASASLLSGKVALEGPIPHGSFLVTGRKSYYDKSMKPFLNDQSVPFDFYDISLKLNYSNPAFYKNGKFSVFGFFSGDDVKNDEPGKENYRFKNALLGINWYQVWASPFHSTMSFTFSEFTGEVLPNGSSAKPRWNYVKDLTTKWNFIYTMQSRDEFSAGMHLKVLLTDLEQQNLRGAVSTMHRKGLSFVWFTKYKFLRFENFVFDLGTRINFISASENRGSFVEPRINIVYRPFSPIRFKASYGHYTQELTTLSNEDEVVSLFEPWILIPGYLNPIESDHFVLGTEITVSNQLRFLAEGYYKMLTDIPVPNPDKYTKYDNDFVAASGEAYGLETEIEFNNAYVTCNASYALSWSYEEMQGKKYPPRYDTRHTVKLLADLNLGYGWNISATWNLRSGMPYTPINGFYNRLDLDLFEDEMQYLHHTPQFLYGEKNSGRLPVYHRLDAGISKVFSLWNSEVRLNASIINVYDRKNLFYFDKETGEKVNMLPFLPAFSVRVKL